MATKTNTATLTKSNAKVQRAKRPSKIVEDYSEKQRELPNIEPNHTMSFEPYTKALLKRAIDNVRSNTGAQLEDAVARTEIENRAAVLDATNGDLGLALTCIAEVGGSDRETASNIYSLCYNVMKAAMFIGNLDLRRWLDPNADNDKTPRADLREDHREAPYGLGPDHPDTEFSENTIYQSLRDLNIFLSTTAEAFGWENPDGMPYAIIQVDNGWKSIYDVEHALDILEVTRQKRLTAQRAKRAASMGAAAALARKQALALVKELQS